MSRKALNASEMKNENQKKILDILRINPVSRAELARRTGLTRAGISVIIEELISRGMVVEWESVPEKAEEISAGPKKAGRKSVELKLNESQFVIGAISIARDCCTVGISNFCCEILESRKIFPENGKYEPQAVLERAALLLEEMCAGQKEKLLGIGITAPGVLDVASGYLLSPPNFPGWHDLGVCDFFKSKFKCPVVLENNAKAIALTEKYYAGEEGVGNYVEIVVDYGIGGGIVIDGTLYEGSFHSGSEFGHMTVDFTGEQCSCGNRGCAELYATIPNIIAYAQSFDPGVTTWEEIVNRAYAGDSAMEAVLERELECLAAVITNVVNIVDPEVVFLGGDILFRQELWMNRIQKKVNQRIMRKNLNEVVISSTKIRSHKRLVPCVNLLLSRLIDNAYVLNREKP